MCTRPLIGIPVGKTDKGKIKYSISKYQEDLFEKESTTLLSHQRNPYCDAIIIPCGKCPECRLKYAKQWSDRCMLELKQHDSNYFLTLTFNDDYLSRYKYIVKDNHNKDTVRYSVPKSEFQKFMKRLRKNTGQKISYLMCYEYGSINKRPHAHYIIFGLKLDDLQFYKLSETNEPLYTSPTLDKCWTYEEEVPFSDKKISLSKGYIVVGSVTAESCSYVARYTTKKAYGYDESNYLRENGMQPEYISMSLRPAIGRTWFEENKDIVSERTHVIGQNGQKIRFPRIYKRYLENDTNDLEILEDIKDYNFANQVDSSYQASLLSSKDFLGRLEDKEISLNAKKACFNRNL